MQSSYPEKLVDYNGHIDPYPEMYEFFNAAYDFGKFISAMQSMVDRIGCSFDYNDCTFPNLDDPEEYFHFEGVKFSICDDDIILSEKEAFEGARMACEKYIARHPEDEAKVRALMAQFPKE